MDVSCGTERMTLQMLICPVYFCGYNESLMALNSQHSMERCRGVADWTVDPPVLRFNFSITQEDLAVCANKLTVTQERGTTVFSDYSSLQFINISGQVKSQDPSTGGVSYHEEMMYRFSCRYPLQYLVSNASQMSVSGANLAINQDSGSFRSTLRMALYSDRHYSSFLRIPAGGLKLKTRIFVEVAAFDLGNSFNVILDHCYATAFSLDSLTHDLFVGCRRDVQTIIAVNGEEQSARFSFEAFRFVQQKSGSTFYLHCSTRLCERSSCPAAMENCSTSAFGVRRSGGGVGGRSTRVSDSATVRSGLIVIRPDDDDESEDADITQQGKQKVMLGVAIVAGILSVVLLSLVAYIARQVWGSAGSLRRDSLRLERS
ncbi:Zona pellucida-like domain-containing protein 1 [Merluccius polli]|uniref:Zona pellucida-like domain-containing protein 1 n=1 Tax=Merluccius polli TaxID=89951 RepID=A0AA47MFX8_MERPO|nr:Zona pellucida-like domain-containing protein 1 [Merluccius polli]